MTLLEIEEARKIRVQRLIDLLTSTDNDFKSLFERDFDNFIHNWEHNKKVFNKPLKQTA